MKKILFILLVLCTFSTFSQKVYFCFGLDEHGNTYECKDVWDVSKEGTTIYFKLVMDEGTIDCNLVAFQVFKVDPVTNVENAYKLNPVNIKEGARNCLTNFTFYEGGTFKVYVVCEDDLEPEIIAVGKVILKLQ
jgi:hypothetical protein